MTQKLMFKGVSAGIIAYGKALRLISKLGLWGYVLIPALISLFLAAMIGFSAWNLSDDIGHQLIAWYPWETGQAIVESIGTFFSGIFVIALGLMLYKHLIILLSVPFMSPLSEKVENHLRGNTAPIRFSMTNLIKDLIRGLRIALRNIIRESFYLVLLLIASLIPIFSPFTGHFFIMKICKFISKYDVGTNFIF